MTAFRVSSSAAGLSCTGLKCHAYYEVNTAKRSFIPVCLFIALFSVPAVWNQTIAAFGDGGIVRV